MQIVLSISKKNTSTKNITLVKLRSERGGRMRILLSLVFICSGFASLLDDVNPKYAELTHELQQNGYVAKFGDDAKWRPLFVGLQGQIEHLLAQALENHKINDLLGIIHTPMPTTPLCNKPHLEITEGLVDKQIKTDPARLKTVLDRSLILRKFLTANGQLQVVYPKGGLERRSPEQQSIYLQELAKHSNLIDIQVNKPFPDNLVGATYTFNTPEGIMIFSIRARQANAPEDNAPWEIWFAPEDNALCKKRKNQVCNWIAADSSD